MLAGSQLQELGRLRDLAEQQLQEALETIQAEREQKQELRRELAVYAGGRHDSLNSLQTNLEELSHSHTTECEEQDSGFASGSNVGGLTSTPHSFQPAPGLVADLFSELSLAEIHKLQQQLQQVRKSKLWLGVGNKESGLDRVMICNTDCILIEQRSEQICFNGQQCSFRYTTSNELKTKVNGQGMCRIN